ncbi:MAG: membrane protein insertion efficiency factor YidD [Candidatus Nanopelagicales bacterium]
MGRTSAGVSGCASAARVRQLFRPGGRCAAGGEATVRILHSIVRIPALVVIGLIKIYQKFVSPMFGPSCKFHPTCSAYAVQSLQVHGLVKGSMLSVARLGRCHPWQLGGINPPPPAGKWRADVDLDGNPRGVSCSS